MSVLTSRVLLLFFLKKKKTEKATLAHAPVETKKTCIKQSMLPCLIGEWQCHSHFFFPNPIIPNIFVN